MKGCDLLVIEDDPAIRSLIRQTVAELGLKLHEESDGVAGESRARDYLPSVILLDLGLPNRSGLEILRGIKSWFQGSVIVITAWQDEEIKFQAFDLGADDYVTKPFSPRELLARIRVALRRTTNRHQPEEAPALSVGRLQIDQRAHRVGIAEGADLTLTLTEYKFLLALAREPGVLVSQKRLLEKIWGPNHASDTHYLRILVSRLRKKLDPKVTGVGIVTEPGLGYRLMILSGEGV